MGVALAGNEARRELLLKKEQGNAVLDFLFAVNNRLTSCTLGHLKFLCFRSENFPVITRVGG